MLDLKQFISAFIDFREGVITRRTIYLLKRARERAHILADYLLLWSSRSCDRMIAIRPILQQLARNSWLETASGGCSAFY